jgi:hypothetical protein
VENFRGKTDPDYLERLKKAYALEIEKMAGKSKD